MDSLKSDISTLNQEISQINETVSQILSQKETMGSSFVALEAEFKTVSKELVRMSTQVELKGQSVKEEENGLESLEDSLKEVNNQYQNLFSLRSHTSKLRKFYKAEQQVVDCKANLAKLAQEFESARAEHESKTVFIKKQEELLQTLTTGMSASEGHENGYMDQLQGK